MLVCKSTLAYYAEASTAKTKPFSTVGSDRRLFIERRLSVRRSLAALLHHAHPRL
jgi:hypothetical protein